MQGGRHQVIWLVRHGQSKANAGEATQDWQNIPLTELGREQAEAVAQATDVAPDRVIVSPFTRARETAAPFLARFPHLQAEEGEVQEFTYLDAAGAAGMTIAQREPLREAYWSRQDPYYRDGFQTETFQELFQRVEMLLSNGNGKKTFAGNLRGETVVFTHGQFMQAIAFRILRPRMAMPDRPSPEDMAKFRGFCAAMPVANCAIMGLYRVGDGWAVTGPSTTHLKGILVSF